MALNRSIVVGLLLSSGFWAGAAPAAESRLPSALVSIVIDDVGNSPRDGRRAIALPAPIGIAILPHTAHSGVLADEAHRAGKEVLLHLPMDPDDDAEPVGPGRIEMNMPAREIEAMFAYDLKTVPHAIGVNNHMGSRLTQNTNAMDALMRTIRAHGGLLFLDSRTSPNSIAAKSATEHGVPTLQRDVFLDNQRDTQSIRQSLERVERLLAVRGHAIAIGHPYPETLSALEAWLPTLAARNIRVVSLTTMLELESKKQAQPAVDRTSPSGSGP